MQRHSTPSQRHEDEGWQDQAAEWQEGPEQQQEVEGYGGQEQQLTEQQEEKGVGQGQLQQQQQEEEGEGGGHKLRQQQQDGTASQRPAASVALQQRMGVKGGQGCTSPELDPAAAPDPAAAEQADTGVGAGAHLAGEQQLAAPESGGASYEHSGKSQQPAPSFCVEVEDGGVCGGQGTGGGRDDVSGLLDAADDGLEQDSSGAQQVSLSFGAAAPTCMSCASTTACQTSWLDACAWG